MGRPIYSFQVYVFRDGLGTVAFSSASTVTCTSAIFFQFHSLTLFVRQCILDTNFTVQVIGSLDRNLSLFRNAGTGGLDDFLNFAGQSDISAEKLLTIAKIAHEEFASDLRSVLKKPLPQAKKALKKFPSIGDPGAEKILLLTGSYPVMALDSNGLRVLCRVGFAEEQKNYSATYRLVQDALCEQLPRDYESLIRAHQLLRQHGQELCKRSKPRCDECPIKGACHYGRRV